MNKRIVVVIFALLGLLVISACASSQGTSAASLTGTQWVLTELNGQSPVPGTTITAAFTEEGQVTGSSGCNTYNGSYEIDGDTIKFGLTATTMMACPDPIMNQERDYLGALESAGTYEIANDELTLFDANGDPVAVFAVESQELAGTSWIVISYNNGKEAVVSVIIDTEITADFGDDGQLTGNASCNNYFGPYETDGNKISIGPLAFTEMACLDVEGLMDQESQYLAALQTADTYKIEGGRMEMRTAEGALVANFARQ